MSETIWTETYEQKLKAMLRKVIERKESQSFPLLQTDYEIIKDIRRKHSLCRDKKGKIIQPVHRREFRRYYRPSI